MELSFLAILIPAALADSINPCAFAILFVILASIISQTGSKTKALQAGLAFCLAVFISYYAVGLGIYQMLLFASSYTYLQLIAAGLAIAIGLGNLKDYFWYGKYFTMEMPEKFKKLSKKYIKKITTPTGAFFIGILLSLFLLPCTSGPYLTVLTYLASENTSLQLMGYLYLVIYNLVFITPFLAITFLVYFSVSDVAVLKEYREYYVQEIHLVVGLLMLGLGLYILGDIYIW
ncbi:hypothetical protein LAT59_01950 [Candidatus Gracilibacteria bacterium]|nr:hypothetical protein [Candidatus Gracilibacteria bacterium]